MGQTVRTSGVSEVPGAKPGATQALRDRRPESLSARSDGKTAAGEVADFKEPEQGSDELLAKHAEEKRIEGVLQQRDRNVKFATLLMLSAAESIIIAKSPRE